MKLLAIRLVFLFFVVLTARSSPTVASEEDVIVDAKNINDKQQCGLYLAVSSTSTAEEPKWGVYAGKEFRKGESVGFGEIAVQSINLLGNNAVENEDEQDRLIEIVEFFEGFIWVPSSSGGTFLLEGGRVVSAIPGAGVLSGFNPQLTNADWNHSHAYHRPAWNEEPGVTHPGRGAYSDFFNVVMSASQKIPVGMEIFINYGDSWNEENEDDEEESEEITQEDHQKVDETIDKMIEFFDKHNDDLDETARQEIYEFLIRDVMAAAAGAKKGAKISSMLPPSPDGLKDVKKNGGSLKLASPTALRALDWLQKHGRCMDNIRPGPSTIPHAGRGAFATRDIPEGGLVAPLPLIQVIDEDVFLMHEVKSKHDENDEEYFVRASDDVIGRQMLLNYCFGHPESKLVFFPAGAYSSFINHSKEPNAKLVWSDHPNNHKHWFDLEPEGLLQSENQFMGLLMEIVATKEIKEGEEVFIDYGAEWTAAWEEHVENWKQEVENGKIPSTWPIRAIDLNEEHTTKPFDIEGEYPDNVLLRCFLIVKKPEDEPLTNEKGEKVRLWSDNPKTMETENLFQCKIVEREERAGGWFYTIRWESSDHDATVVKNVPHKAIVFVDRPGTSDQFLPYGFRHYIGIPDEIFPQSWHNAVAADEVKAEE